MSTVSELVNALFPKKDVKMADMTTVNGETIEAESFEAGSEAFLRTAEGELIPLPEGEYELEDKSTLVVDAESKIVEVKPAEEVEAKEETPTAEPEDKEAMAKEDEPNYVTVEALEDFKREILAGFSTMSEHIKEVKSEEKEEVKDEAKVEMSAQAELDALKEKMHKPEVLGAKEKAAHKIEKKESGRRKFSNPTASRIARNNEKYVK